MTTQELCKGLDNNVRPEFKRPKQDRRCHGIVDDERHAVCVRYVRHGFKVANITRRIADAFTVNGYCVSVDQGLDIFGTIGLGETDANA